MNATCLAGAKAAALPPLTAADIPWTPLIAPVDWMANLDPALGLAGIVVRLIEMNRLRAEVVSAALGRIAEQDAELRAARRRITSLVEEIRAMRRQSS